MTAMTVAAISILSFTAANAQKKGEFGLRFMPTVSTFDMQSSTGGTVSGTATLGLGMGAFAAYNFTDNIGVQVEGIYTSVSQKYKELNTERKVTLRYVNVPLLLSLNTGKSKKVNFNIVAGPQIGVSVGSKLFTTSSDSSSAQAILSVKKGDLGLAYGAGLDFGLNESRTVRLSVGFRGVYGLLDISDNNQTTSNGSYYILDRAKIQTYSGYVGLSIMF